MPKQRDEYPVQPARHIYRNGQPLLFIGLGMKSGEPGWDPAEVGALTHVVCALLNQRQPQKGERS